LNIKLKNLSLADRATIANMAPEYGATCGFFPTDDETIKYLKFSGRDENTIALVEKYSKEQGLWSDQNEKIEFTDTISLDLNSVVPSISGPKRPQDKVLLTSASKDFDKAFKENTKRKVPLEAKVKNTDLKEIFKSWRIWINRFTNNNFQFSIFDNFFYCVWFLDNEINSDKTIDLVTGLENYYSFHLKQKKIEALMQNINGIIFKQTNVEKKNLNMQSNLLSNSENHLAYKEKADQIFMNYQIKKKDIIEGQKLYKKSKKLKRAQELIKERIDIYKNKLNRLDEFSALLENLNSLKYEELIIKIKLLEEIREEICNEFNIKIKKKREEKKYISEIGSSPIQINTPRGLKLQIGRNMRQNDLISFKFSSKGDLWFHAQESPGSHVVLKSSSQTASEEDLQIAADLAALFSKARRNIKVPINLVKIKDLQKITKGGPGCVSFKKGEIIWGNPTRGEDYMKNNLKAVI